ncbi:hypothetical protein WDZ92_50540, partial [Nostoc sp. NIES-2111]
GHARWTPHDLRRTLVTAMHEADVDEGLIRKIVGHVAPDVHGRTYNKATKLDAMRQALTQYEEHVCAPVAEAGNVISLAARK